MAAVRVSRDLFQPFPQSVAIGLGHTRQFLLRFGAEIQGHVLQSALTVSPVKLVP
jgi:hypothetical protein